MMKPGRLFVMLLLITAVIVALIRVREQGVPYAQVAVTGVVFVGGLLLFFALLLGAGKLLGRLFSRDE